MRKHKKLAAILAACAMSAVMACTALAPCVSAAETAQDPAAVKQYNLADENWDELIHLENPNGQAEAEPEPVEEVSSAAEETTGGWKGNTASDGGMSKLLIIAIIAFALGGVGVTFFIYSQFIYKAKLKRKLAAKQAEEAAKEDFNLNGPVQLDFTDHRKDAPEEKKEEPKATLPQEKTHTQKVNDFFAEFEKETKGSGGMKTDPFAKKRQQQADKNTLSKDDEKKLNSVDWDNFFNNH